MGEAGEDTANPATPPESLSCDFCGAEVPRVRRVALDADYDRLRTPHRVQYACQACSEKKERDRRNGASS
jgi:hypothetical protein